MSSEPASDQTHTHTRDQAPVQAPDQTPAPARPPVDPSLPIDPALTRLRAFTALTGRTTAHIQQMRQDAIFTDAAVPARLKALAAMLWSISARCEPCLTYYVRKAQALGATNAEIGEYLAVACAMGGCVGEMWALKAFAAIADPSSAGAPPVDPPAAPDCCA